MDKIQVSVKRLQAQLDKVPALQTAEQKTGVPKLYMVGAGGLLFLMLLFVGFGPALLTNIVGVGYPAFASFKAINSAQKDDNVQWLSYWVIFSSINLFEFFLSIIGLVIPYFHGIKFGLLLWLFLPQTTGAKFLWEHFLSSLYEQVRHQLQAAAEGPDSAPAAKKD